MKPRVIHLLDELDEKVVRYAELRGLTAAEVIASAVETHMRFVAEQAFRLADARKAHEQANPRDRAEA